MAELDFLFHGCFARESLGACGGLFFPRRFALHAVAAHDDDIYTSIALAAGFRVIGINGVGICITDNCHSLGSHTKLFVQKPEHRNTARRGEFPVTLKTAVIDWKRIRVSFQPEGIRQRVQNFGNFLDGWIGATPQSGACQTGKRPRPLVL